MQIIFFAARRLQRDYFQQLCQHIDCSTQVAWYKAIWFPGLSGLTQLPLLELKSIVANKIKEKQNASRTAKPRVYWRLYSGLRLLGAMWQFLVYYRYFHRHPCAMIGLWNGNKFRQRVVVAVAHTLQRRLVYFENGLLPNTTTVDFCGVNAYNSVPRDAAFYRQLSFAAGRPLPQQLVERKAETAKPSDGQTTLPERFIFVPFQVNTDSQITLHSPWIRNMWQLFAAIDTARQALNNDNLHFVFKEHPSCPQAYDELHRRCQGDEHILFANDRSTQELIQGAEAVIIINSTVGLESLLLGKKVIVLGDAFYAIDSLTMHAYNQTELTATLTRLGEWQPDTQLRENFLRYLHDDYAIPDNWTQPSATHWQALNQRLDCSEAAKPVALFLVSTPLNLFVASGITISHADTLTPHLVFIDQSEIEDNPYIKAVQNWAESPFQSVTVLPPKANRSARKLKVRRNTLLQLETLIHQLKPTRIFTGNDRRVEFQFAMHTASGVSSKVVGAYMDDGTFSYVGRADKGLQDTLVDNLLKKLVYGSWWRQPETVGSSSWISEAHVAFPQQVHSLIRKKEVHTLGAECFRSPAVQALSTQVLAQFAVIPNDFQNLDILFTLPHDSLIKDKSGYGRTMVAAIEILQQQGLHIGIKYHPRHDPANDLTLDTLDNSHVIPQHLGFEAILPMLGNTTIIGDVSTTLLSSKWLRPDLRSISVMFASGKLDDEFIALFHKLGIPVVENTQALLAQFGFNKSGDDT